MKPVCCIPQIQKKKPKNKAKFCVYAIDGWLDRTIPSNRTFPERFYQQSDLLEILPKKV